MLESLLAPDEKPHANTIVRDSFARVGFAAHSGFRSDRLMERSTSAILSLVDAMLHSPNRCFNATYTLSNTNPMSSSATADFGVLRRITELHEFSRRLGAMDISDDARQVAQAIVASLSPMFAIPKVRLSRDGEIGLYWFKKLDRVRAILDQNDRRLYWIGEFHGHIFPGADLAWSDEAPGALREMLGRLYKTI